MYLGMHKQRPQRLTRCDHLQSHTRIQHKYQPVRLQRLNAILFVHLSRQQKTGEKNMRFSCFGISICS